MRPAILCFSNRPSLIDASAKSGWDILFAANTEHAMKALSSQPFEAVAVEAGPGANPESYGSFLKNVMTLFPEPARLLLYNPAEQKKVPTNAALIQQCLTLPTSADLLISAAQRAWLVGRLLNASGIKTLLPELRKLPSVPSVYFRVAQAVKSIDCDLEQVGAIMAEDPVMTAKLLQVANSAYFALPTSVTHPAEAIGHLGLERVKALILIAHLFSAFEAEKEAHFAVQKLWDHSMTVARFAQAIAQYEWGRTELAEAAYSAGLLHDLGKFILAANCPKKYNLALESAVRSKKSFVETEQAVLGTTHAEIAACILGTWGLPGSIVEALAYHHYPNRCHTTEFSVTTAVHAANVLSHTLAPGDDGLITLDWDFDHLEKIGLTNRPETWKGICAAASLRSKRDA